jgi:hypothetical protein
MPTLEPSKLRMRAVELLRDRPMSLSLKKIAAATGLTVAWLQYFQAKGDDVSANVDRVEALWLHLSGTISREELNKRTDDGGVIAFLNRKRHLRQSYKLTPAEYEAYVVKQAGKCAICGAFTKLHVDHDHLTNIVRGLLCGNCNRGIGMLKDDTNILAAAIAYLSQKKLNVL